MNTPSHPTPSLLSPLDSPVVARHAFLTDNAGELLPIYRLTSEACPVCPRRPQSVLGIAFTSRDARSETVQCLTCDYQLTRPVKDPPGRKMNQGTASTT